MMTEIERTAAIRAALRERISDLRQLHPWLVDDYGGSGVLGGVVFLTSCRYRYAAVRDYRNLAILQRVTLHANHALALRATGEVLLDGCVSADGAGIRTSPGPRGVPVAITEHAEGFRVSCPDCGRVHMSAQATSLEAWGPFVWGFGGEVFLCSCGVEAELRFD